MKTAICFFLFFAVAFAIDTYTTRYDSIDIDALLANQRLYRNYFNCLLDLGKCNEEGNTLKSVIPDALITACAKCSEKQKKSVEKVIRFMVERQREDWEALLKKYDPQGTYRTNYKGILEQGHF